MLPIIDQTTKHGQVIQQNRNELYPKQNQQQSSQKVIKFDFRQVQKKESVMSTQNSTQSLYLSKTAHQSNQQAPSVTTNAEAMSSGAQAQLYNSGLKKRLSNQQQFELNNFMQQSPISSNLKATSSLVLPQGRRSQQRQMLEIKDESGTNGNGSFLPSTPIGSRSAIRRGKEKSIEMPSPSQFRIKRGSASPIATKMMHQTNFPSDGKHSKMFSQDNTDLHQQYLRTQNLHMPIIP